MVGQSLVLSPPPAAPASPRLSSPAGFPSLPPIASAFGATRVKDAPKKLSPMKHNPRPSRSPSPAFKRWQTSTCFPEHSQKQLHAMRHKTAQSQSETEKLRGERDQLALKLEKAQLKLTKEKEISASYQNKMKDLDEEVNMLQEQLKCQGFIRKQMEVEHKRSLELTCARHRFELEDMKTRYDKEIQSLNDRLEETVLQAAIDLNRQHRQLSSEQLKILRGRRRATDGGVPLEVDMPPAAKPEKSTTSSGELHSSSSVPKIVHAAPNPDAAADTRRRSQPTTTGDIKKGTVKSNKSPDKHETHPLQDSSYSYSHSGTSHHRRSSSMCSSASTSEIDTTLGLACSDTSVTL